MPRMATEPLTKVTLNLYLADVEWFKRHYGQGWSEILRTVVRSHVKFHDDRERLPPFGTGEYDE